MLGSERHALFIRDWYVLMQSNQYWDEEPPKGWKRIGSGISRTAFLGPDGAVYKVEQYYDPENFQSNAGEAETLRNHLLTRLPLGCRLPRYTYYELDGRGVMVMEYFEKLVTKVPNGTLERSRYTNLARELMRILRLEDLYGSNLAVDHDGTLVPIDLGC